jgi:hypothetical protein
MKTNDGKLGPDKSWDARLSVDRELDPVAFGQSVGDVDVENGVAVGQVDGRCSRSCRLHFCRSNFVSVLRAKNKEV